MQAAGFVRSAEQSAGRTCRPHHRCSSVRKRAGAGSGERRQEGGEGGDGACMLGVPLFLRLPGMSSRAPSGYPPRLAFSSTFCPLPSPPAAWIFWRLVRVAMAGDRMLPVCTPSLHHGVAASAGGSEVSAVGSAVRLWKLLWRLAVWRFELHSRRDLGMIWVKLASYARYLPVSSICRVLTPVKPPLHRPSPPLLFHPTPHVQVRPL